MAGGIGAGGNGLTWTGAIWSLAAGKALNTPTEGGEDVANGTMEAGNPPTSWTPVNSVVLAGEADERTSGAGSQSMSLTNGDDLYGRATQTLDNLDGTWIFIRGWAKKITSYIYIDVKTSGGTNIASSGTTSTSWVELLKTTRLIGNGCYISVALDNVSGNEARADDVSVKPLTLSTLFRSLVVSTQNVIATTEIVWTNNKTQAGLVLNLDDAATPANFVIAYLDGLGNCKLDKCVAGTYTNVISAAVTYVSGAQIRVIKDGTSYRLFYNNLAVGAVSTISDAGIVDNTLHGLFSTYSGNTFDNFTVYARGNSGEYSALEAM